MRLYKILEELRRSGRYAFTTGDLARILGSTREVATVYVHRMKEHGFIYPVEKGKFALGRDAFIVASQLVEPSYLSFTTAFYLHGRMEQVIDRIYVVTSRKKKAMSFMGTEIEFVRFHPFRIFGYRRHRKSDSYVLLADIEKAVVDSLYMPGHAPVSLVYEILSEGFERERLEEYAIKMNSEAVIRRVGYLLELLGEETALEPSSRTVYRLNPSIHRKGKYIGKWRLYVNEVI